MSDTPPDVTLPPFLQTVVAAGARHAVGYIAGILGGYGLLGATGQTQLISLGVSIALAGATYALSYVEKQTARSNWITAILSPAANIK